MTRRIEVMGLGEIGYLLHVSPPHTITAPTEEREKNTRLGN